MKNDDLFELETDLATGCNSKHWPLLKRWLPMLAKVREAVAPMRARCAPTDAVKSFQRALARLRAENAAENRDVLNEKIRNLVREHAQAQLDLDEIRQLEQDMREDSTEIEFDPIPEELLHDGGVLRIEPHALLTLSRLGLIKEK
jgi:hypothetical protein